MGPAGVDVAHSRFDFFQSVFPSTGMKAKRKPASNRAWRSRRPGGWCC